MIKKLISLARNIRESDLEEIVKMENNLKHDERFNKEYNHHIAQEVYSAYIALKEYSKIKLLMREEDKDSKHDPIVSKYFNYRRETDKLHNVNKRNGLKDDK